MAYVHIIVDLCLETWCSCFYINFITTKFIADNVSLNDMRNLLTNNFMILNYLIHMIWHYWFIPLGYCMSPKSMFVQSIFCVCYVRFYSYAIDAKCMKI